MNTDRWLITVETVPTAEASARHYRLQLRDTDQVSADLDPPLRSVDELADALLAGLTITGSLVIEGAVPQA